MLLPQEGLQCTTAQHKSLDIVFFSGLLSSLLVSKFCTIRFCGRDLCSSIHSVMYHTAWSFPLEAVACAMNDLSPSICITIDEILSHVASSYHSSVWCFSVELPLSASFTLEYQNLLSAGKIWYFLIVPPGNPSSYVREEVCHFIQPFHLFMGLCYSCDCTHFVASIFEIHLWNLPLVWVRPY